MITLWYFFYFFIFWRAHLTLDPWIPLSPGRPGGPAGPGWPLLPGRPINPISPRVPYEKHSWIQPKYDLLHSTQTSGLVKKKTVEHRLVNSSPSSWAQMQYLTMEPLAPDSPFSPSSPLMPWQRERVEHRHCITVVLLNMHHLMWLTKEMIPTGCNIIWIPTMLPLIPEGPIAPIWPWVPWVAQTDRDVIKWTHSVSLYQRG